MTIDHDTHMSPTFLPDWLPLAEFARRKGLSIPTLRRLIAAERLRTIQPTGRRGKVYVHRDALNEFELARDSAPQDQFNLIVDNEPAPPQSPQRRPSTPRWRRGLAQ